MPPLTVEVYYDEWWAQCAISSIAVSVAVCYICWWFYTEIIDYTK